MMLTNFSKRRAFVGKFLGRQYDIVIGRTWMGSTNDITCLVSDEEKNGSKAYMLYCLKVRKCRTIPLLYDKVRNHRTRD